MLIWLVTIGEPIPTDGNGDDRSYRAGILGKRLVIAGHQVVWWTSTFDHVRKEHRFASDVTIHFDNGIVGKLLHGCGYAKNISLRRLLDHIILSFKFKYQSEMMPDPDIILCSLPPLELPNAAIRYGVLHKVPVVLDIRDLWPDLFLEIVPKWLRPIFKLGIFPLSYLASAACKNAFAITGNAPAFVEWGILRSSRVKTKFDQYFPFGYEIPILTENQRKIAESFWKSHHIGQKNSIFKICFFGSIGKQCDLETVIHAAQILESRGVDVKFVICGDGENLAHLKIMAKDRRNVVFPGWIGRAEIWKLMEFSDVGIAPYKNNVGFIDNLPNKPIEYFAGGLPVISCIRGYLAELLATNDCGLNYESGNPYSLANIIELLINDREHLMRLSKNASLIFSNKFSADLVYGEMSIYLKRIVTEYGGAIAPN